MKFKFSILFFALFGFAQAQENVTFQKPSQEILQLADFQRPPAIMMSQDKQWVVSTYRPTYKSLDELNQSEVKLAGLRINPVTNISSTTVYLDNIKVKRFGEKVDRQITGLPINPKIANVSFSPDGKKLAFTNTTTNGVELWLVDLAAAAATKITKDDLNANMELPYTWFKDGQKLLLSKLPANRNKLIDSSKDLPKGPIVSTSDGQVSQLRTYQDLLKNPQDEANFETLTQAEVFITDLNGNQSKFLGSAIYSQLSFSPDGNYLLTSIIKRPFSYVVPLNSFPQESVVYDLKGSRIKVVNEVPLIEIMPKGFSSVRKGKRSLHWRTDKPASLAFVQALDEGDATKKVDLRDELLSWDAPFTGEPESLMKIADRFGGVSWGDQNNTLVYSNWYDTRNVKTFLLNPTTKVSKLIADRNSQDVYSDPGKVYTERNAFGSNVMSVQNGKTYWIGEGFTKDGQFPFIDELDMRTLTKKRVYTATARDKKEVINSILDIKKGDILVSLQSATEYPNYFTKNIKSGKQTAVTNVENPFKGLEAVSKEVIHYKRKDGVSLSGTLYLPAGYDKTKKEKLPLLIWAYPREFKDQSTAGQSTANPNEYTFPSYGSFIYWVMKGYAVLDNAAFPIIGAGTAEPNDTFIEQLVANGEAAIDAVDKLGYIDRTRVGVGGHSYGAFMTANLLTHSKLFAVGIARSGAYNRTLTPFGFQSEQRNYWDVPEVYNTMSPFMNADKMKTPMLLIHGAADNNPGTFTLQTERYFQALKNLGAPVRMVLLPFESHGYASKENILHTLWEQDQFLEKYLKKK
ncbi:S9 family peptidase [Sphingobacterium psychroaquaticum]|uniref:alpha/beta hydrolase family protein n=1 Tax=Sphingobacterium psychroaquaticum TaxID=561061 RepID=UPI00106CCE8F|nr:prolyl oligopeptidase family serine peptidase [Sphingobacterium psychroaquaticum]QBQ39907.1 S9 family peptidase [Sphingobacterium psychroaquaticum]